MAYNVPCYIACADVLSAYTNDFTESYHTVANDNNDVDEYVNELNRGMSRESFSKNSIFTAFDKFAVCNGIRRVIRGKFMLIELI